MNDGIHFKIDSTNYHVVKSEYLLQLFEQA